MIGRCSIESLVKGLFLQLGSMFQTRQPFWLKGAMIGRCSIDIESLIKGLF
jgi:hypothetical protein